MIFSQATCLETRQRMWVGRDVQTDQQRCYSATGTPISVETAWIAGVYSEKYQSEALAKIPTFDWD
tara:strand:+ start:248 stop:445 length:198 start_codon:yes stop_codon:yes gene_type:complete